MRMFSMSGPGRVALAAALTAAVVGPLLAGATQAAEPGDPVGQVTRIQGEAYAALDGQVRYLAVGDTVFATEDIWTDGGTRLLLSLVDGSQVTLGGRARVQVDDLIVGDQGGALDLRSLAGPFILQAAQVMQGEVTTVETPVATIGIRGTTVWGGPIDGAFGVLALEGTVTVETSRGTVLLQRPNEGTTVVGPDALPTNPAPWNPTKIERANALVAFDE